MLLYRYKEMEQQITKKLYSKKHLLDALRAEGLPCTYPTLLKYERLNVINKPKETITFDDREWRLYTRDEIEIITLASKQYQRRIKPPTRAKLKKIAELAALKAKAEATIDAVLKEVKHY
jgi:hypothetical protein